MKKLVIILLLICQNSWASEEHSIRLNLTPENVVYDKLLDDLWRHIPSRVNLGVIPLDQEGKLNTQISHGNIEFGNLGKALFKVEVLEKNQVRIHWNLANIRAYLYVRADFYVEVLGVRIRKHEDFHINASRVVGASSVFELEFNNGKFKLEPIGNNGIAFQHIDVRSTDDDFTSWVLKRMRGKVSEALNYKVAEYLNGPEAVGKIKKAANEQLSAFESLDLDFGSYATNLGLRFNQFDFEKKRVAVGMGLTFDRSGYELHPCARGMEGELEGIKSFDPEIKVNKENLNNGTVLVPHDFINQVLYNLGLLKFDLDENGVTDEPIFCTGFEDEEGSGDLEEFEVGSRKLQIRIWSRPLNIPKIRYFEENQVELKMKTVFRIVPEGGYPKMSLKKDEMEANVTARLEVGIVPGKGLMLKVKDVKMKLLSGKFYYKHGKLIPKIKISFKRVKEKFENAIFEKLEKAVSDKVLLDEVLGENIKLKLESYKALEDDHEIRFNLL